MESVFESGAGILNAELESRGLRIEEVKKQGIRNPSKTISVYLLRFTVAPPPEGSKAFPVWYVVSVGEDKTKTECLGPPYDLPWVWTTRDRIK